MVQIVEVAGHVDAFFQLDDMPRSHPTVEGGLDGAGRIGTIIHQLFDCFDGEIRQVLKGR